ncbi:MAG: hypothetical protein AVDCRST_MAG02-165, partial [uncultured Rubrobacteraceae bacterium]
ELPVRRRGFAGASGGVPGWARGAGRVPRRALQGRVVAAVELQDRGGGAGVVREDLREVRGVPFGGRLRRDGRRQEVLADGMDQSPALRQVRGRQEEQAPRGGRPGEEPGGGDFPREVAPGGGRRGVPAAQGGAQAAKRV